MIHGRAFRKGLNLTGLEDLSGLITHGGCYPPTRLSSHCNTPRKDKVLKRRTIMTYKTLRLNIDG